MGSSQAVYRWTETDCRDSWVADVRSLQGDWTVLLFSCPLYFFPLYSTRPVFHCLISILLFPYAGVWENTRAWQHEFPISYSHTELNFFSSGTNTLLWWRACYQKLNYKQQKAAFWPTWLDEIKWLWIFRPKGLFLCLLSCASCRVSVQKSAGRFVWPCYCLLFSIVMIYYKYDTNHFILSFLFTKCAVIDAIFFIFWFVKKIVLLCIGSKLVTD